MVKQSYTHWQRQNYTHWNSSVNTQNNTFSVYLFSIHLCFSPHRNTWWCIGGNSLTVSNTHMHTLIQSHINNCVFWQDIQTGDYTHAADGGISLSPLLILFHSPWKEWGRERQRMRDRKTKRILISWVRCVGAFISASCVQPHTQTHTHKFTLTCIEYQMVVVCYTKALQLKFTLAFLIEQI